jgi:hypothetical protein
LDVFSTEWGQRQERKQKREKREHLPQTVKYTLSLTRTTLRKEDDVLDSRLTVFVDERRSLRGIEIGLGKKTQVGQFENWCNYS